MKWFKHLSESHSDEKLAQIIAVHGLEGYGFWWLLVEIIANLTGKNDDKCSASYPLSYWMRLTGFYHFKKLKMLVESMHNLSLIYAQCEGNVSSISSLSPKDVLTISMPNILKYRDEYSKKSGQTPESVRSKKQKQIQNIETEEEIKTPPMKMTLAVIRNRFREIIGQELGGGVNQTLSEICKNYTPESIESALIATSTRLPAPKNPFMYFVKVLEGQSVQTSSDYDPSKTYEPGTFFYDWQQSQKQI